MKHLKTLGLAMLAAAALMAILGVGTASATTLENKTEVLEVGSFIKAHLESGTKWKLTTTFKTVECSESELTAATTNKTGGEVFANATWTLGNCNCEVKVLSGGTISTAWINGTSDGTFVSSGFEFTTTCSTVFGNIHCLYRTKSTTLGTLTGSKTTGATATIDINETEIPREPTMPQCTEKGRWDGNYIVENPDTLNVIN